MAQFDRQELFSTAKELGIEFKGNISNSDLNDLIEVAKSNTDIENDDDNILNDLMLTADDLGIKYQSNVTKEWLVSKIAEAKARNEDDDVGEYFTAVNQDCFIFMQTFKVGIPYLLSEWDKNEKIKEKLDAQFNAGYLEMIKNVNPD